MSHTDRKTILKSLYDKVAQGKAIVGAGAGIGLSAKFIEAGGGDMIIIYNSGRFRMAGRGSLAGLMPYGNANDIVLDMVRVTTPHRRRFQWRQYTKDNKLEKAGN
jgi:predicted TIM-barrel enzyme